MRFLEDVPCSWFQWDWGVTSVHGGKSARKSLLSLPTHPWEEPWPCSLPIGKSLPSFPFTLKNAVSILDGVMRNGESKKLIDEGNYGSEFQGIRWHHKSESYWEGSVHSQSQDPELPCWGFPWGPAYVRSCWRSEDGSRQKSDICSPRSHF